MAGLRHPTVIRPRPPRQRQLSLDDDRVLSRVVRVPISYSDPRLSEQVAKGLSGLGFVDQLKGLGRRCLLMGNFNSPDPYPASTDLGLLKVVVRKLKTLGLEVTIGASAGIPWFPSSEVTAKLGVDTLARDLDAKLWITDQSKRWVDVETPYQGWKVLLPERLFNFQCMVYMALMKAHRFAGFSQGMKLSMCLIHPWTRRTMHFTNLEERIAALAAVVQPDLIIADGRLSFLTGGPEAGLLAQPAVILLGSNQLTMEVQGMRELARAARQQGIDLEVKPHEERIISFSRKLGINSSPKGSYQLLEI